MEGVKISVAYSSSVTLVTTPFVMLCTDVLNMDAESAVTKLSSEKVKFLIDGSTKSESFTGSENLNSTVSTFPSTFTLSRDTAERIVGEALPTTSIPVVSLNKF